MTTVAKVAASEGTTVIPSRPEVAPALERLVGSVVDSAGAELVDVELAAKTLRITVESTPSLDLDRLAELSKAISAELDANPDLTPGGRYELEVSTPGVERRLRRPGHFQRAVGNRVAIKTVAGTPGDRRFEGVLSRADDRQIVVVGDDGTEHCLNHGEVDRAHVTFDWRAALAESKPRREQSARKRPE